MTPGEALDVVYNRISRVQSNVRADILEIGSQDAWDNGYLAGLAEAKRQILCTQGELFE